MHIAFNAWFWNQTNTGSGQYLRRLVKHLRKLDSSLKLTVVMPPHNPQPEDVPEGVEVVATGNKSSSSNLGKVLFEQRTFPQVVGRLSADIAHVPYWGSPLRCPVPMVTSVLDVIPLLYPIYQPGLMGRLYTSLVIASARGSSHILTISQTSKVDIERRLGIPKDQITVTYLAPDERYHPKMGAEHDEAVREKYDLPDQFVLYLGGFDMRKQVNEILLAYTYVGEAEGENIPLVLAGKIPDWGTSLFPDLPEYARRLEINDYVRWLGYVDEADKPALYRLADVFVWSSEYEGFGLPPLEAMASGTPVVAYNSIVAEEILESDAFLVDNAREMAGAIIALLIQDPLRQTMVNQGLALATRYRWRKTAQQTLKAYERLLQLESG